MENEKTSVNIEDMTPKQSLDAIWSMLNKAATKGAFTIDESYILKVLFSKVSNSLNKTDGNISYNTEDNNV